MVIACSSSSYNLVETVSTLRFGVRAKTIKNRATTHVEYSLDEYKSLLAKSRGKLSSCLQRVKLLEKIIVDAGLELPAASFVEGKLPLPSLAIQSLLQRSVQYGLLGEIAIMKTYKKLFLSDRGKR